MVTPRKKPAIPRKKAAPKKTKIAAAVGDLSTMTRGEKVVAFIENYCLIPEGTKVGQKMLLDPFQKNFIIAVYDNPAGTRRAYLSIARKNGKTALIAALVLAHVCGPEAIQNSQVVSGARSRDQAALVFNLAAKMINLSAILRNLVKIVPSSKRLVGVNKNVEYRALAADGTTAHGLSPILAILDEVGQVQGPQDAFIDAITTSQGAHEAPILMAISTQAPTDADLLSIWIDDALESKDPKIVCHLYAAEQDADVDDPEAWKAANPAIGSFRSLVDVEEQAKQAKRMPSAENTFRNLTLNQRVQMFSPFIARSVWNKNNGKPRSLDECVVVGGLDLSQSLDLTAFHLIGVDEDERQHWHTYFWTPLDTIRDRQDRDKAPYQLWVDQGFIRAVPGKVIDYGVVVRDMHEICEDLDLRAIGFDRWRMDFLNKEIERYDLDFPMEPFGQGFKDMSPAIEQVETHMVQGNVNHGDNPVLNWCAANAVIVQDPSGNRKLDKVKSTGRIDGIVAAVMAEGMLSKEMLEAESGFETI